MTLSNLAQLRDQFRRLINQVPLTDQTGNVADQGKPAAAYPRPTNAVINDCINRAISRINTYTGFHVNQGLPVTVVGSTSAIGPFYVDISTINLPSTPQQSINSLRRLEWSSGGTSSTLTPTDPREQDFNRIDYSNAPAGQPRWWWIDGYKLAISPYPSTSGTLTAEGGVGLVTLVNDTDGIDQLPTDYILGVLRMSVVEYGKIDANDPEGQARAAAFAAQAAEDLESIKAFVSTGNEAYQPAIKYQSYRTGQGMRRIRR